MGLSGLSRDEGDHSCTSSFRPPLLRSRKGEKIGIIPFIPSVPQYSQAQAESIVESLRGKEDLMNAFAAAVLLPRHGIFVAGKDLWSVLDALERISINAWCLIAQRILE